MTDPADALLALSRRERRLIGLLVGVVIPLAVVFLVLAPIREAQREAARDLASRRAQLDWIATQAELHPPVPESTGATSGAPGGLAGLEQSLVSAGLREQVSALTNRRDDAVELRFDSIAYGALMPWLDKVARDVGYVPTTFTIEATPVSGTVSARLILETTR
jgi:type II secretory pathway component PulM